ncbi:MAG: dihydroorotate dehydrogenase electron transfer subunit [Clostridiales bacterium]|jgi:dihydroorotate dehydrogenase electron transfer subunit|nr:dihydroorotate dehydrogenase electron transfer subunit [Clostridiales bacterium]
MPKGRGIRRIITEMRMFCAEIITNDPLSEDIYDMRLSAPQDICNEALPGQFLHIGVGDGKHLLPRPISVCGVNRQSNKIRLVYQVAGSGTRLFSRMQPGEELKALGPCGNGFFLEINNRAILVGGGIGAPPLLFLAAGLREGNPGIKLSAVLGFRSAPILKEDFLKSCDEVFISTDDGSLGFHGNAAEFLRTRLRQETKFKAKSSEESVIFSCGPRPMLESVAGYANELGMPCQVSMEEHMACGLGVCLGCPVKVKAEGGWKYARVCKDGPVFQGNEVVW